MLPFNTEIIAVSLFWGIVLLRGELRKYAQNSNLDNFESALYSTLVTIMAYWHVSQEMDLRVPMGLFVGKKNYNFSLLICIKDKLNRKNKMHLKF